MVILYFYPKWLKGGAKIMQLTEQQVIAIKKKRGELDYTVSQLADITHVNRRTLTQIFKHGHRNVNKETFEKLNNWIIETYTTA